MLNSYMVTCAAVISISSMFGSIRWSTVRFSCLVLLWSRFGINFPNWDIFPSPRESFPVENPLHDWSSFHAKEWGKVAVMDCARRNFSLLSRFRSTVRLWRTKHGNRRRGLRVSPVKATGSRTRPGNSGFLSIFLGEISVFSLFLTKIFSTNLRKKKYLGWDRNLVA